MFNRLADLAQHRGRRVVIVAVFVMVATIATATLTALPPAHAEVRDRGSIA